MGANPFAAMSSDHFASAAMTAMLLAEQSPVFGTLGWSYALALAFTLVDLGEHYVIDEVAGLILAFAVNRARGPVERVASHVLELFDIEPVSGGCCGLAGSWGFEQGHHELSMQCGEARAQSH